MGGEVDATGGKASYCCSPSRSNTLRGTGGAMVAANARATRGRRKKADPPRDKQQHAEAPADQAKSIFLFADGTGNSSGKLFKTNVWRMYEAIDFGAASKDRKHVQVGYYDNGVGTSAFRPLALLGGIFGIGLHSNVLRLYTFLCRNYCEGDRIYMFGFSRGAYTIRLLADFVCHQGILAASEASLSYQVRQAYREYRRVFKPNLPFGRAFVFLGRGVRDLLLSIGNKLAALVRDPPESPSHCYPEIDFVGVWDTVGAYGGPFAEFTRGIDDWVFPLTMPDYHLNPKVKKARHALSLDDERDAFWPLLWDEVFEQQLIDKGGPVTIGREPNGKPIEEKRRVAPDRLRQVWFAGVHSDVGGGYPDESLSYIPLLWMMDELGENVDFLETFVQRARDLANPLGPIHDSRAGVGAYYRYQPRKIAAFMGGDSTVSLRQPLLNGKPAWGGLLRSVCVHESVFTRIFFGIDNYAPSALPARFDVVTANGRYAIPMLSKADRDKLVNKTGEESRERFELQEEVWNRVWGRRLIYFLTIGFTFLLVIAPWTSWLKGVDQLCSDDRCFARSFIDVGLFFVPQGLRDSLSPWASVPLDVILLGIIIFALIAWGRRTERRFRDGVRAIWRDYLGLGPCLRPPAGKRSGLRRFRESLGYQGTVFILKWNLLPAACGLATLLVLLYAAIIAATQIIYARAESESTFCRPEGGVDETATNVSFDTRDWCKDLKIRVHKDTPYRLTIVAMPAKPMPGDPKRTTSPWFDLHDAADPRRGVTDRHMIMFAAAPLKRVTSANWMQVITEVRAERPDTVARRLASPIFGKGIDMRKHVLTFMNNQTYETIFCPRWDGRMFIMVNDAAPLLSKRFYENNRGGALVSVAPAPDKQCTK